MDPRLDLQGRPWRLDSEWALGMSIAAFMWMQAPPHLPGGSRYAIPIDHGQSEDMEEAILKAEFEVSTTISQLKPGLKESYSLLPFRALEDFCLPSAIQQSWEASVAASKSAEWRLWFKTLDQKQQKAYVQRLSKSTKDTFWAGLWLEYEEWSKPRHARFIAAAARALVILERENVRKQRKEAEEVLRLSILQLNTRTERYGHYGYRLEDTSIDIFGTEPEDVPGSGPLSAPLTPHDIFSLRLRLAPCYFRLPASAFRFATQIFSGKSYEEAVAEQRANFNSWTKESRTRRIDGQSDFVVWGKIAVHKNAVPKFTPKKKQPRTGKHRYQNKQSWSGDEKGY